MNEQWFSEDPSTAIRKAWISGRDDRAGLVKSGVSGCMAGCAALYRTGCHPERHGDERRESQRSRGILSHTDKSAIF